jgi:hypothetical protein
VTGSASTDERASVDLVDALASMHTGALVECDATGPERQRLEDFAAIIPSLFRAHDLAPLGEVLSRLGSEGQGTSLREVLIVSAEHVHVMKPLSDGRGVALLATSPATNNVGLVLSAVHRRTAELEGE